MRRDVAGAGRCRRARTLVQVDDVQRVAGVRIPAVNAVAEDRHIGAAGLRQHQQLVHGALEAVEHRLGLVGRGVQEQDLPAHLVDRDQAARGMRMYSVSSSLRQAPAIALPAASVLAEPPRSRVRVFGVGQRRLDRLHDRGGGFAARRDARASWRPTRSARPGWRSPAPRCPAPSRAPARTPRGICAPD